MKLEGAGMIQVEANSVKKKKSVSILGSCVTRDIFEYMDSEIYEIKNYFARTKIVSQLSPPLDCSEKDIDLESAFKKKQVLNDFQKDQFKKLSANPSDYCLIDYIDERFPLIKVSKTYVTKSNELVISGWLDNKFYKEKQYKFWGNKWRLGYKYIGGYIENYLDQVTSCFEESNLIIHKAYMVNSYLDQSGKRCTFDAPYLNYNKRVNKMLDFLYDFTISYLPGVKVIDLCDGYCADAQHKWGLSPMHYQKEYYIEAANAIREFFS